MATVPATRTWVAGEVVTATHFNVNIRDVLNFLLSPPIFKGRQASAQTLTTGATTAVTLDTEDVDSAGGHSTSSNTSRYTAQYAGWYSCKGHGVGYASNATGLRAADIGINGSNQAASGVLLAPITGATTRVPGRGGFLVFLNVNDYVELQAFQSSGGNLNTAVTNQEQPGLGVKWESN